MITKEEADFAAKQEISNGDDAKIYTARKTTATSTWSRLKDPRIVRVSRAMGGKDRHSKVCTVRGLRDRRVRLSVPTAIQLYDLQERIGLSQPSKVVDWLLDAAKKEIDELPPLQIPQGITFNPNKEALEEKHVFSSERNDRSWTGRSEEESHEFHLQNPSSFASLISSSSYGRWDPSISLGLAAHQHQDFPSHQHQQHQLLVYQSGMITQPYFVPQINAPFDTKHPSFHSSDLSSSSHGVRAFDFSMTADLLPSLNDEENKRGHPQT